MPPFQLCATPQLYGMCYLSESSVKLETLVNSWNLESGESSESFSRNRDFCSICLLSTSELSGGDPLPSAPLWGCHPLHIPLAALFLGDLSARLSAPKASSEGRGWIFTISSISSATARRWSVSSFSQSKVMT